ncbi:MAG TPA: hypothetical protein VFZ49_04705 [Pyrinomonadaceae bacterium]
MPNSIEVRPAASIIILFILFLLTQPCGDILGAPSQVGVETSFSQPANDDDCQDGEDGCSPFCICSCRQAPAGRFTIDSAPVRMVFIIVPQTSQIDYECRVTSPFTDPIWLPPKY